MVFLSAIMKVRVRWWLQWRLCWCSGEAFGSVAFARPTTTTAAAAAIKSRGMIWTLKTQHYY